MENGKGVPHDAADWSAYQLPQLDSQEGATLYADDPDLRLDQQVDEDLFKQSEEEQASICIK